MPRGRKRVEAAAVAPSSAAASQGASKRIRVGAGAGARGRVNTRSSMDEFEEGSEHASVANQPDDEDVGEELNPCVAEDDDIDDDKEAELTRKALRDLQAVMERTEKKDNHAKEFEKCVGEEERRLLGLIEAGMRERESETEGFHSKIIPLISAALAPTGAKASAPKAGSKSDAQKLSLEDVSFDKHPLYNKSQALLQSTESLFQEYENLTTYISNLEAPPDPAEMWERDCAETRRVIAIGVEASQSEIDRLLDRNDDARKRKSKEKTASKERKVGRRANAQVLEKDEHLQAMLKMGMENDDLQKEPYGWGKMAYQVVKGMKTLVKVLPSEKKG